MTVGGVALGFFAVVGIAASGAFTLFFFEALSERRADRANLERFKNRPKARIVAIGTIVRDAAGGEHPSGFTFDCEGKVRARGLGPNGEALVAGWTNAELLEVAKRRKEFE